MVVVTGRHVVLGLLLAALLAAPASARTSVYYVDSEVKLVLDGLPPEEHGEALQAQYEQASAESWNGADDALPDEARIPVVRRTMAEGQPTIDPFDTMTFRQQVANGHKDAKYQAGVRTACDLRILTHMPACSTEVDVPTPQHQDGPVDRKQGAMAIWSGETRKQPEDDGRSLPSSTTTTASAQPEPRPARPAPALATAPAGLAPVGHQDAPLPAALAGSLAMGSIAILLLWLFSRIRQKRLLDHPVRRRIVRAVQADPGIHFAALARAAGVSHTGTRHHVDLLLQHGVLRGVSVGKRQRYFHADTPMHHSECIQQAVLRNGNRSQLLELITCRPGITVSELAHETGMPLSLAHSHVKKLHGVGLIRRERDGRRVRLMATGA